MADINLINNIYCVFEMLLFLKIAFNINHQVLHNKTVDGLKQKL